MLWLNLILCFLAGFLFVISIDCIISVIKKLWKNTATDDASVNTYNKHTDKYTEKRMTRSMPDWLLISIIVILTVISVSLMISALVTGNSKNSDIPKTISETTNTVSTESETEPTAYYAVETKETNILIEPEITEPSSEPTNETTIAPSVELADEYETDYVLNRNSMKFHFPGCSSAKKIKPSNRGEYHGTREELIRRGFDPCGRCHP